MRPLLETFPSFMMPRFLGRRSKLFQNRAFDFPLFVIFVSQIFTVIFASLPVFVKNRMRELFNKPDLSDKRRRRATIRLQFLAYLIEFHRYFAFITVFAKI